MITSEESGLRLSIKKVHGLVVLLRKGGGSTDRVRDYRPVALLNSLFKLFRLIRAACFANLKGSIGLMLAKASVMRVTMTLDLSTRSFIPIIPSSLSFTGFFVHHSKRDIKKT